jgi:hypothetical protein
MIALIVRRPMLELAYWIGPQPGVWNAQIDQELDLQRYRDMRPSRQTRPYFRNRWVVAHFHIDETRPVFLPGANGHSYFGFVSH